MTIRRRDRGLSGDDMGCDGSWDMTDDLLERLREVSGADALFDALADVPGVWVVGGAVRDTLLGREPRDLDLVVEGDAAAAARLLGEEPLVHERFGTATATGERQPRPGARASATSARVRCPRSSSARRSPRTSRAATSPSTRSPCGCADGELEAVPGALEDLAARRLRVLHERSFLDDPTRLLRLVRYAARLRFQIEEDTRGVGVRRGRGRRAGDRHRGAARRRAAAAGGRADAERGVRAGGLRARARAAPGLRRRPRPGRARPAPDARTTRGPDLVALAACLLDASAPALAARLDAFEFTARERDTVVAAATRARAIAPVLGGTEGALGDLDAAAARGARDGRAGRRARRGGGRAPVARPAAAPQARDHRRRPARRRARGPGDRPRARRRDGGDARRRGRGARGPARRGAGRPARMTGVDLPEPFSWRDEHIGASLPGGELLFSTRRGGVSEGPFASLNLGRLTDDPGENVDENRARLAAAVGAPRERFLYGRQVHEATVRRATEPPGPQRPHAPEDGQATALEDAPALVFVADCLPVMLVADGAVAALHGGWRGLAAGIVAEGAAALRELGAEGEISAALGPSARGCCYEVGEEVHAALRRLRRARRRAQPRPREGRAAAARRRRRRARSTTSGCARCAPSPGCSSPTAATAASPGARRGSCGGPDHRPRARDGGAGGRARAGRDRRGGAARGPRPGRRRAARGGQVRRARGAAACSRRPA